MRFLVIGAGALGGYYDGQLVRGGQDVTFLVRGKRVAELVQSGLIVTIMMENSVRPLRQFKQKKSLNAMMSSCCAANHTTWTPLLRLLLRSSGQKRWSCQC